MAKVPSAVWIVDTKKEHLAVDEARKLGLPVIAILDTNGDPDEVDYKIPGNDDAIRSVTPSTRDRRRRGRRPDLPPGKSGEQAEGVVAGDEPLAEWGARAARGEAAETAEATAPEAGETAGADARGCRRRPGCRRGRGRCPRGCDRRRRQGLSHHSTDDEHINDEGDNIYGELHRR